MTIKLNIPSPNTVQPRPQSEQTFRLTASDGKRFIQISRIDFEAQFPAALTAHIAAGNSRLLLNDIPESVHAEMVSSLRAAGWFTQIRWFADLDLLPVAAVPFTAFAYHVVPHLMWHAEPFPPTFEKRVWIWIKSWFA